MYVKCLLFEFENCTSKLSLKLRHKTEDEKPKMALVYRPRKMIFHLIAGGLCALGGIFILTLPIPIVVNSFARYGFGINNNLSRVYFLFY